VAVYILARGPIDIALLISLAILLNKKAKHIIQILQSKGKSTKKRKKIQENMLRKLRNRWQRFNYRKFLCAAGAHLQATTPPRPLSEPPRPLASNSRPHNFSLLTILAVVVATRDLQAKREKRRKAGKSGKSCLECERMFAPEQEIL